MSNIVSFFESGVELRNSSQQLFGMLQAHDPTILEVTLDQFSDVTLFDINNSISLLVESLLGLQDQDSNVDGSTLLHANLSALSSGMLTCVTAINTLKTEISRRSGGEGIQISLIGETCTLNFKSGDSVVDSYAAETNVNNLVSGLGIVANLLGSMLVFVKSKSGADLTARANELRQIVTEVSGFEKRAKTASKDIAKVNESIVATDQAAKEKLSEVSTLAASIQTLMTQVTADSSAVTSMMTTIKSVNEEAQKLELSVKNYKIEFEGFQDEMDSRNESYSTLFDKLKSSESRLSSLLSEVERLTELSNAMLSGATTAGISTSLADTRDRYELRMNQMRKGFIISIVFLVVSGSVSIWMWYGLYAEHAGASEGVAWSNIVRGLALMIPATWLTAFFARSYAHYFQLEREYSHKTALAMAVDGFKKQAPTYEQEIAAAVFIEIKKNPASSSEVDPVKHPWLDMFSRLIPFRKVAANSTSDEAR